MGKLFRDKMFIIGFANGIVFFLCINLFIFFYSQCHHCLNVAGFPIIFWERFLGNPSFNPDTGEFTSNDFEHFFVYKMVADILIAVASSFVVGLIFKSVQSKLSSRRSLLK